MKQNENLIKLEPGTEKVVQKGENGEKQQQHLFMSIQLLVKSWRRNTTTKSNKRASGRNRTLWHLRKVPQGHKMNLIQRTER